MFKQLIDLFRQPDYGDIDFNRATEEDVHFCYRLFLNRQPDPESLDYWLGMVRNHHITLAHLTDAFLYGEELYELQEARNRPQLIELPNYKLFVRPNDYFIGGLIAREKMYEAHVTQLLTSLLKPNMTFLDIGGNIGYFTMLGASLVGDGGQVLTFEPVSANCELIHLSMAENGFEQVELYPYAVANKPATFALDREGRNSNSRVVAVGEKGEGLEEVEAVVLDDFLPAFPNIHLIKMDIEGAEPLALQGMNHLIETHHPTIVFEFSPDLIQATSHVTPESFLLQLQAHGYQIFLIPMNTNAKVDFDKPMTTAQIMALCNNLSFANHLDLVAK